MTRLPAVTPRQMVAALKRAGFQQHHQKGSHLFLWNPETKRMTTVSQHVRDLKRDTMKKIIEQAGLTDDEFRALL